MYVKGDVIITDPCYFMNEISEMPEEYYLLKPQRKDFFTYKTIKEYPDSRVKNKTEYDDYDEELLDWARSLNNKPWTEKTLSNDFFSDLAEQVKSGLCISEQYDAEEILYEKALEEWKAPYSDDFEKCNHGKNLEVFGFTNFLTSFTRYGDWCCTVLNDNGESIGDFCADSATVSVVLLDEVLKYNPSFDYHINLSYTTTWIRDFDGEITIEDDGEEVFALGKGNINFKTVQHGF